MGKDDRLLLVLHGRLRLLTPDGQDRAPRGNKARGLLALLGTAPSMSRGRLWLQARLWSDRAPEQAAGSLRQALTEIRTALGPWAAVLRADRLSVALDRVQLAEPTPEEFLEGGDVRDPEFESWLREQRAGAPDSTRHGPAMAPHAALPEGRGVQHLPSAPPVRRPPATRPVVHLRALGGSDSRLRLVEDLFVDLVGRCLSEALSIDVRVSGSGPSDLDIEVQALDRAAREMGLRVRLLGRADGVLHWSGVRTVPMQGGPPVEDLDILGLGNQLIDAVAEALRRRVTCHAGARDANFLGWMAVRRMFSMIDGEVAEADRMLAEAHDLDPRAIWLGWRAQLRVIQSVERHGIDAGAARAESRDLVRRALMLEPGNAIVLATAANQRLVIDDDPIAARILAEQAVAANPGSPLAWDTLSLARLYQGDADAAHASSIRAQRLGLSAPNRFWWDMGRCLTAALTGRAEEAMRMAEQASALAPEFRPPLRYLVAFYARAERFEDAARVARRLSALEPDFEVRRLHADPTYPVSLLRRGGLLDGDRLRVIGG